MASSSKDLRSRKKSKNRGSSIPLPFSAEPSPSLFPSKEELLRLVTVIAIAVSVAAGCHFTVVFLNRGPKSFCDSDLPFPLDPSYDSCDPCPQNARCYEGKFECVNGFQKHGRICIEDGMINRKSKELSELLEKHTCNAHARVLCGEEAGNIWFEEAELEKILNEQITAKFNDLKGDSAEFAKLRALDSLENLLEKNDNAIGKKEFKCPDSMAKLHMPIKCKINQWIHKNIKYLVLTTSLIFSSLYFLSRFYRKRVLQKRAENLYQQICEILEDNARNNNNEAWVVSSWLRDHLLLPKERKNSLLWKKVEELIQEDSRIDQYPKKIKGESKIVLEWQVDVTLSSKIRKVQSGDKSKQANVVIGSSSLNEKKNERKSILGVKLFS